MPERYHSLDLWRGVACLSVLAYHAYAIRSGNGPLDLLTWGWLGVPLFFVISGYCIAAAVDQHARRGDRLWRFAWRRWRRIFPPYLWIVALTVGASVVFPLEAWLKRPYHSLGAVPMPGDLLPWQWIGSLTLTEGWRTHLIWRGGPQWYLAHAWTLGYEEQFYAAMGLLAVVCGRHWRVGAAFVTLATVGCVLLIRPESIAGYFFDGQWLMFACGVAVYTHTGPWRSAAIVVAAEAFAVWQGNWSLETAAAFAAALIALRRADARLIASPSLAPLAWCGVRCYSIYLIHYPVVRLVATVLSSQHDSGLWAATVIVPAATIATLGAAAIFHRYCERPWLNTRQLPTPRTNRVFAPDAGAASHALSPAYVRPDPLL